MTDTDVSDAVATGKRSTALRVMADKLAYELDEKKAAQHRRECRCVCGAVDVRAMVAVVKELRSTLAELDGLPVEASEEDPLDRIAGAHADEVAAKRARRVADAAG